MWWGLYNKGRFKKILMNPTNEAFSTIRKTKLGYTAVFFVVYMFYRSEIYGRHVREELVGLVPVLLIILYYIIVCPLIFFSQKSTANDAIDSLRTAIMVDFFCEVSFYASSVMIIFSEESNDYLVLKTIIISLIDILFMFLVFRKNISTVFKKDLVNNGNIPLIVYPFFTFLAILVYWGATFLFEALWTKTTL
jgi:hypothetical protein